GPNVGRWDYINSREDMFHHDPSMVFPNPPSVTMTEPSMSYYTRRNALLALLAGAMPIGGMAAQMQNPRAADGALLHQRQAARHLSSELGRDGGARLRRRGARAARRRLQRPAAHRR